METDCQPRPDSEPASVKPEFLFAYGTLQPGLAPDAIADAVRNLRIIGRGYTEGTLYDFGTHPGAILDHNSSRRIFGTIFQLPSDQDLLPHLDEYEEYFPESQQRSLFIRRGCQAHLDDGAVLNCWVYELNGTPDGAAIIESGVFPG